MSVADVPADVPNERSRAAMERLGMRLDHVVSLRDGEDGCGAAVYAITQVEWEAGLVPTSTAWCGCVPTRGRPPMRTARNLHKPLFFLKNRNHPERPASVS